MACVEMLKIVRDNARRAPATERCPHFSSSTSRRNKNVLRIRLTRVAPVVRKMAQDAREMTGQTVFA